MHDNRPTYRVSADRHSASRRVRYVERSAASDDCQLCQLDTTRFPDDPQPACDARPLNDPKQPD
ncbi:MAG TPA: hypothetical protein VL129_09590 [Pseudomonas sp.]|jgi:hypothetical protein|uniref:hypothetical protein n=1 Tax=Pseudomonas sp. TaxID=306 RepID=UPI002C8C5769|nr:hypothetical protein [Pseudomonas sp.]HTO19382.1 hypothetical protein [Pseudomonas sp.]